MRIQLTIFIIFAVRYYLLTQKNESKQKLRFIIGSVSLNQSITERSNSAKENQRVNF